MTNPTDVFGPFRTLAAALALAAALLAQPASAQDAADDEQGDEAPHTAEMRAIDIPDQPNAIELGTPELPGAQNKESWHFQYGRVFARNVTVATLTPFLPEEGKATGAACIVAPGGGFRTLSMENEGWDVAQALADQGVAAFVLKYRLNQTPASLEDFQRPGGGAGPGPRSDRERPAGGEAPREGGRDARDGRGRFLGPQLEDAEAAFQMIRDRADEWNVDPDRIGMVGFSAGAALTMTTALQSDTAKPAFVGNVYGGLNAVENVPDDAPPLFVAIAADDPLFRMTFGLVESWAGAGHPVELHYYEQGGHGFGMYNKETTSTGWFDAFSRWLGMHGYLEYDRSSHPVAE